MPRNRGHRKTSRHHRLLFICTLFVLSLAGCGKDATAPGPPGTDDGPRRASGLPVGWAGGRAGGFETGLDSTQYRSGEAAAYLTSTVPTPSGFVALGQAIRPEPYRGHRIRWSGWVRQTDVGGDGGGLWVRVDGPGSQLAFDNMDDRPLLGSSDWHQVSVVLEVPEEALGLEMGVLLSGPGDLLVDDFQLEIVGDEIPTTKPTDPEPSAADSATLAQYYARASAAPVNLDFEGLGGVPPVTVDWLGAHTHPFESVLPDAGDSELAFLDPLIGEASVVGAGEGTHGTSEFFQMKDRLFRYLVRQKGFTYFAIEATSPEADDIDQYVLNGVGDPAKLLSHLYFWTWNTQEVRDLMDWMRQWNADASPDAQVHFVGFDMQFPTEAEDRLLAGLGQVDPPGRSFASDRLECIRRFSNDGPSFVRSRTDYAALPDSARDSCHAALEQVYDTVRAGRNAYVAASSDSAYQALLHDARLVQQFEALASVSSDEGSASATRDSFMAENVLWLRSQAPPGTKMMLWAHDYHVSRLPRAMGDSIARALGAGYLNIGQTFGTGSFNAVDSRSHRLGAVSTSFVTDGSVEASFQMVGKPHLILDAREIPGGGAAAAPLAGPILMRSVGAVFDPGAEAGYYGWYKLPSDFDLLIYHAVSTPTRLLPFSY